MFAIPRRYSHFIFAVIQSGLTCLIAAGIARLSSVTMGQFLVHWLLSWVTGWNVAMLMTKVIEARGADLSPQNIIRQATSWKGVALPGLIPGITVNTASDDYRLIKIAQAPALRWRSLDSHIRHH